MHVEVQVALNFLISFLYNKLPRRRVNQFGEELEKALRQKFQGHWYPEKPMKGSAYRCLKTTFPLDPVFEKASIECGMDLRDIQENLPKELSIWIDPGEVSYRLEEKGPIKGLYSVSDIFEESGEREISRTFNPEAQSFKPIDSVASQLGGLSLNCAPATTTSTPSPTYKSTSPVNGFIPKTATPLTFTTATFAQTKFGSTKLKNNSKRSHRLSPTELGNSIKQRFMMQQVQQLAQQQLVPSSIPQSAAMASAIFAAGGNCGVSAPQRPRSLSPNPQPQFDPNFLLMASLQQPQFTPNTAQFSSSASGTFVPSGMFDVNLKGYSNDFISSSNISSAVSTTPVTGTTKMTYQSLASPTSMTAVNSRFSSFFEKSFGSNGNSLGGLNLNLPPSDSTTFGMDPLNVGGVSYTNQYQHLLMAN
ncbi:protein Tob1-like [Limulus polyphemus]|uniref:Protein Tob1-like n=1 Tax=Limulus polyphemus TaxID=6850 RepID=A0ABM1B9P2_LIMPO|nr:protein Tob1-like [Limulus polyphemus]XP_013777655.1 protein Tob1-like [Limulus polyphemus]